MTNLRRAPGSSDPGRKSCGKTHGSLSSPPQVPALGEEQSCASGMLLRTGAVRLGQPPCHDAGRVTPRFRHAATVLRTGRLPCMGHSNARTCRVAGKPA